MAFDTETLGQALVEQKAISQDNLEKALEEMAKNKNPLETVLVNMDFITHEKIHEAISNSFGMPFVTLNAKKIPEDVLDIITPSAAEMHRAIPCEKKADGSLVVAVADFENLSAIDDLRYTLNIEVNGAITTDEQIEKILEDYYRKKTESIDELIGDLAKLKPDELGGDDVEGISGSGPVVKLLELVLVQAIRDNASDVHFEPFEDNYKIRYRVDGTLYELVPPPKHLAPAIASRIKVMAGLKIAEKRLPQDGRITSRIAGKQIDLRVSTLPTMFGESVVVRILDRESVNLDINSLGFEKDVAELLKEVIFRPNGIILVTGPTGCGKTTTLYGCLAALNTIDSKCITTEDPVEYDVEGIVQVPINPNVGLTYAKSLRSILRQDPDRIMVGEIRDLETTQIAIQASLTGHLVLSTLHTNDAATTITRLIDMGTEPFLLSSTIQCIVAQRLVRKICDNCKEEYTPEEDEMNRVGSKEIFKDTKFFRGKGCPHCHNSGYSGRVGIFEMLTLNEEIRNLINDRAPSVAIKEKGIENGMRTLREDGIIKINRGLTTIEEIIRNTVND